MVNEKHRATGGIVGMGILATEQNTSLLIQECINNKKITGECVVGGIIGVTSYTTIENCTNRGEISSTGYQNYEESENASLAGGIIGVLGYGGENNNIYNCTNTGNVIGAYTRVGGIAGQISKGTIERCYNSGNISSETSYVVGGITGCAGHLEGDISTVANIIESKNEGTIKAIAKVGGIVGVLRKNGTASETSNYGEIYSTGTSENYAETGGICGALGGNATIEYSYNVKTVESSYKSVGGICGRGYGYINYCYNIGDVYNLAGTGMTGGILGVNSNAAVVTNCWQLTGCVKSGTTANNGGFTITEKTAAQIKALTWENFTTKAGVNNGYPILSWEIE